jgi:2-hydroxychromene-2-carboxylate isomerase
VLRASDWVAAPLVSERPLIAYLDFKSPYAYLAVEPTRAMALKLGIQVDWRPLVLDIPSFLGSARLDRSGKVVEQKRSAEQWSGVKYSYFDCRRYASERGITVRGTVKIWNTNLAAIGMLWAQQQGDEILDRYVDGIYEPFWKRELDVEDLDVVHGVLQQAGANLLGFAEYVETQGRQDNETLQAEAFAAGLFGVPSYVVADQIYFGREHLPRIAWHLAGEPGTAPDVGYPVAEVIAPLAGQETSAGQKTLDVCIDFASPLSYLAIAPVLRLAAVGGADVTWHATSRSPLKPPASNLDNDRGALHRRYRAQNLARDIARYAQHPLADIYLPFDTRLARIGLNWVKRAAPAMVGRYVEAMFVRYWRDGQAIDGLADVTQALAAVGVDPEEFARYAGGAGGVEVERSEQALAAWGIMGTPMFFIDGEPFLGRQHLPLIERKLGRVTGP